MHSKLTKNQTRFVRIKNKEFWNHMDDSSKWYLLGNPPLQWFNRKPVPQEIIDLMNGKPAKLRMNIADWRVGKCQVA